MLMVEMMMLVTLILLEMNLDREGRSVNFFTLHISRWPSASSSSPNLTERKRGTSSSLSSSSFFFSSFQFD